MSTPKSLELLEQQRINITNQIAALGDLRCGSITSTTVTCGKTNCHCHLPKDPGYGPNLRLTINSTARRLRESLPDPVEPFRYYLYGERTVHPDGCVEVEAAYYSAPSGWIGGRVQVQWDSRQVRLLDPQNGQLLREHMHQKRGCRAQTRCAIRLRWCDARRDVDR